MESLSNILDWLSAMNLSRLTGLSRISSAQVLLMDVLKGEEVNGNGGHTTIVTKKCVFFLFP